MGLLKEGKWVDRWYQSDDGRFHRQESRFRQQIGDEDFPAETDRYHLYVAAACPWAHRTLIFRRLKGLESHIGLSIVTPLMLENGWQFDRQHADQLYQHQFLYQLYLRAASDYEGRVTVPVLWDKKQQTIVNNESAEIIRIFNSAFDELTGNQLDFYPAALRDEIDQLNDRIYDQVNNGVYRAGFATSQEAYEEAVYPLFETLDWLDQLLGGRRYLTGSKITEADWRLFTTLVRFDAVYYSHFKCNLKRISDYHNLSGYLRELYQLPGIAATFDLMATKKHYFGSHKSLNPSGIIPAGPTLDFGQAHERNHLEANPL